MLTASHGDSKTQGNEPDRATTLQVCTRSSGFASIEVHTAHYTQHTEITLQDIPRLKYTLRLLIGNDEKELQREDNWSWTPAQRSYVLYFLITYTLRIQRLCWGVLRRPPFFPFTWLTSWKAGDYVREEILSAFIRLVMPTPELQHYTVS